MAELLIDIMDSTNTDSVSFVIGDLIHLLNYRSIHAEPCEVRRLLQMCWHLKPASNSLSYHKHVLGISGLKYQSQAAVGRFYTVTKEFIHTLPLF